jgi:microcin C transport system substrate-binding protein
LRRRHLLISPLALLAARAAEAQPASSQPAGSAPAGSTPAGGQPAGAGQPWRGHAISLLFPPRLPADFPYFPYVNPDAPKGGDVALSAIGSFDSFNPFIVRGTPAAGINRVWDTLLRASDDEAATAYGHIAHTIEIGADHSYVAFELRPEARFHDGHALTAEDVAWTFDALREKGRPFYRQYYGDVAAAVAESPTRVRFDLKSARNRELPLTLGEMPILPKHWWEGRDFARPLTDPPLGSGPYKVAKFEFSRTVSYSRVADWWAKDVPTGRGMFNFDGIRHEYFRDATVALEAFKVGQIDFREENIAKQWATAYDFPAVGKGLVRKEQIRHHLPTGMQCFAMNVRRPLFQDRRVRQALALAFDFEWCNRNLFYNSYTRTESYFSNSELASSGLPQGAELALLEPFRAALPAELFTTEYRLPVTDGSGNNRAGLTGAFALLKSAGWKVKDGRLVDANGGPFRFEMLLSDPAFERVALPYRQWLARLGIDMQVRTVDPAQYQRRLDAFDFDMTVTVFGEGESPGNEQIGYWSCASGRQNGGDNIIGICDKVVDALVQQVVTASGRETLIAATHALDRVLLWNWFVVPHWHSQYFRIAFWNRFARPTTPIRNGLDFNIWWIDQAQAAATDTARRAGL